MKDEIINNLNNPFALEKLYRNNKPLFKNSFNSVYNEISDNVVAQAWNERLNHKNDETPVIKKNEILLVCFAAALASLIAKLPAIFDIAEEFFYERNISFVVFPALMIYFLWTEKINYKKLLFSFFILLLAVIYINFLPVNNTSSTLKLSCIHLPLLLWGLLGLVFVGNHYAEGQKRIDFLRYNSDLIIITTLLLIAGALLSAITLGLFSIIDLNIEEFYIKYVIVCGLASAPVVGTYLIQRTPQLVNKISPVIAKIFTPIVLLMLIIYLVAMAYKGKNPYQDREFLLFFNLLLAGVIALIFFSIAETSKNYISKINLYLLVLLALVTIIVNSIALSAIVFRVFSLGITPNRIAVLGGNLLFLINLVLIAIQLLKSIGNNATVDRIENSITSYIPIYVIWALIVVFLFPVAFGFE